MNKGNMHFVTCGQMKILERRADESGLSYYQMMENAGTGAADIIMQTVAYGRPERKGRYSEDLPKVAESGIVVSPNDDERSAVKSPKHVVIFCGKGNNGGDGFVVARKMAENGYDVSVVLVDGEPVTTDSIENHRLLKDMPVNIVDMTNDESGLMKLKGRRPDIIIDAIYGTGFHGNLSGNGLRAAIYINRFAAGRDAANGQSAADSAGECGGPSGGAGEDAAGEDVGRPVIFSLDIPSGLGGDLVSEKDMEKRSVRADYTLTFHARKPVHLQNFAAAYCGRVIVVDIGIDEEKLWNVL